MCILIWVQYSECSIEQETLWTGWRFAWSKNLGNSGLIGSSVGRRELFELKTCKWALRRVEIFTPILYYIYTYYSKGRAGHRVAESMALARTQPAPDNPNWGGIKSWALAHQRSRVNGWAPTNVSEWRSCVWIFFLPRLKFSRSPWHRARNIRLTVLLSTRPTYSYCTRCEIRVIYKLHG